MKRWAYAFLLLLSVVSLATTQTAPSDPASADSLAFSNSRQEDEQVVEPDRGSGVVRRVLSTPFGETALADWLFRGKAIVWLMTALVLGGLVLAYRWGGAGSIELPMAAAGVGNLPLVGAEHPVGRLAMQFSRRAATTSMLAHLLLGGLWVVSRQLPRPTAPMHRVRLITITEMGAPPSITGQALAAPQLNIAEAILAPEIAIPEPVPDEEAPQVETIATQAEMSQALESVTMQDLGLGEGDSFVVAPEVATSPTPEEFIAVDEDPVRIRIDPPVYPEMARSASVEGTVLVRVLVAVDGRVKDTRLVEGHEMLVDAAIQCAKTAIFRPAVMQNRPVEVWVVMPVVFKLN